MFVVPPRSTRDRPAKAPLSEAAIVDAGLAILKSNGLEAVTMRRVAERLDTGPASLYVYLPGRERLLEAMLARVTATVALESPTAERWREQVHRLVDRIRQAFNDHPGIAALTLGHPPLTEETLMVSENMLGLLLAGGIDVQGAAWACDILFLLVTGVAMEDAVRGGVENPQERVETIARTFAELPTDRFPLLTAHAPQLVAGDADRRFRFAVDAVLDGVLARPAS